MPIALRTSRTQAERIRREMRTELLIASNENSSELELLAKTFRPGADVQYRNEKWLVVAALRIDAVLLRQGARKQEAHPDNLKLL